MIHDTARALAREMKESPEYLAYAAAREKAMANETNRSLIKEYHKLQLRAQAATVAGEKTDEVMAQLQKLGELLQFNPQASEFLLTEFKLNRLLADVYKILAEAIDVDLSALEA